MTVYSVPYGSAKQSITVPASCCVDVIVPQELPAAVNPLEAVRAALQNPLEGYGLELFSGAGSAAIAINDKTRPAPHQYLLPPLLECLEQTGFRRENIELIVATGTHLPMPPGEFSKILPAEIIAGYRVSSHDADDPSQLVSLGTTSRGTPVSVNRRYVEAGLRIVVGNIEPHHFMGFSGGVKSAAIGLAGRGTINANHAMLPDPRCKVGAYLENPMRMDVEEIGQMAGVHFALNTIQDSRQRIIRALSGRPQSVMAAGVELSGQFCQVRIEQPYDLVITSPGGYPKDINLYQAQKALTHGALIARDGGTVILVAECREGIGSRPLEAFMQGVHTPQEVFDKFRRLGFAIGPHKAYQIAQIARRVNLLLMSALPEAVARRYFFTPVANAQEALPDLWQRLPAPARVAILPAATHTIPRLLSTQETA